MLRVHFFLALFLLGCSSVPNRPENYREDLEFRPRVPKAIYINLHPKVCFDEGHNNLAVEYGFYDSVLNLIESDGYEVIRLKKRFTPDILKQCKIIYSTTVLGHPDIQEKEAGDTAFDVEEIESIVKWVRKGGSLLLVTDHGAMARASSKLLKEFGIAGSIETVKYTKAMIPVFADPGVFTLQGKELNENSPIILGRNFSERPKKVQFFRGQALKGPKKSIPFLFMPSEAQIGNQTKTQFNSLGLATRFGRGRVVTIGDGSVFAAKIDIRNKEKTGLNRPDNDNTMLALNVFRWLSGAFY